MSGEYEIRLGERFGHFGDLVLEVQVSWAGMEERWRKEISESEPRWCVGGGPDQNVTRSMNVESGNPAK